MRISVACCLLFFSVCSLPSLFRFRFGHRLFHLVFFWWVLRVGSTDTRNLLSSDFCTLYFFSYETKFGRLILHYNTNKRPGASSLLFVFDREVRFTFFEISRQLRPQLTLEQKKKKKITRSFVGIAMKNNPAQFHFTTRKKLGAKVIPVESKLFPRVSKRSIHCSCTL